VGDQVGPHVVAAEVGEGFGEVFFREVDLWGCRVGSDRGCIFLVTSWEGRRGEGRRGQGSVVVWLTSTNIKPPNSFVRFGEERAI
jgi:hypothetical protein